MSPARPRVALLLQNPQIPFVFEAAATEDVDLVLVHLPSAPPPAGLPAVARALPLDVFAARDESLAFLGALHAREPFAGVLTLYEAAVPFTAELAERLGLPGLDPRTARLCRDKHLQRQVYRSIGLPAPRFVRLANGAELPEALASLRLPVVVKPINGLSSQGVTRADTIDEAVAAARIVEAINDETLGRYANAARGESAGVLVEEYVDGPEYCAESVTIGGRTHVLTIAHKGWPTGPHFEEGTYIAPADLPERVVAAICDQLVAAHAALGIDHGASHGELRLRPDGTPVLLEIGARVGGSGVVCFMVERTCGVDLARLVLRQALGRPANQEVPERPGRAARVAANWIVPLGGHGRYSGLRGLDRALVHPDTARVLELLPPGALVAAFPRFQGYPAFVLSQHAGHRECVEYQGWLAAELVSEWEEP
jgi:D-alanine-D-alanine ligase-like ATP-grasp enzyme